MIDEVEYQVPWGIVGRLARAAFVMRTLERIFDFRRDRLNEVFRPNERA
jgi:ligand-binding SRPBCC domain-containing protein